MHKIDSYNEPWIKYVGETKQKITFSNAFEEVKRFIKNDGAYRIKSMPVPLLFNLEDFDSLADAGKIIVNAQTKILRYLLAKHSTKGILKLLGVPIYVEKYINWSELIENNYLLARIDIVPSNEKFYFCELNFGSMIGGSEQFECYQNYLSSLNVADLITGVVAPRVEMAHLIQRAASETNRTKIVIFTLSHYHNNGYISFDLFKSYLEKVTGLSVVICDETNYPSELNVAKSANHILIYRVFIAEDIPKNKNLFNRLWKSGALIISGFESELRMSKNWFSLFNDCEFRALLTKRETTTIDGILPKTLTLNRSNIINILAKKDKFIFKNSDSYGGKGIIVGLEQSIDEIFSVLEESELSDWSAQCFIQCDGIKIPRKLFLNSEPCNVVLGLYLVGDKVSGMYVRASSVSNVVNVSQGTAISGWAFPIQDGKREALIEILRNKDLRCG